MKVAILSPFHPYRGGIAQFSAMLYTALEKEHEIKAFSFSRLYPDFLFPGKSQYVEPGDKAIQIPAERILDSINPFSFGTTVRKIKAFEPDVLIICYWMSFFIPGYAHIANRLKNKTKVIVLLHNAIAHEPRVFDVPLTKLFFNQCSGFIVMSEAVKNDLLKIKPDAKYILKPHPLYNHFGEKIDRTKAVAHLGLNPDMKTLLFFGLIRDYKGLDILIDAMSEIDETYQLVIAGECYGSFEKYESQIAQSPAKNRIHVFNQYIDDEKVPYFFSAADLLVLPYKSATQSGVIPVAYHFDVPVLATNVGGLKDYIESASTGIVCQPDAHSIAAGINQLFASGKESFVKNIIKEKENLSWEQFAKSILK